MRFGGDDDDRLFLGQTGPQKISDYASEEGVVVIELHGVTVLRAADRIGDGGMNVSAGLLRVPQAYCCHELTSSGHILIQRPRPLVVPAYGSVRITFGSIAFLAPRVRLGPTMVH